MLRGHVSFLSKEQPMTAMHAMRLNRNVKVMFQEAPPFTTIALVVEIRVFAAVILRRVPHGGTGQCGASVSAVGMCI